jgi:hypothetical protein
LLEASLYRTLDAMAVCINPDLHAKVDKLTTKAGRPTSELVEDVVAGYFHELAQTREILNSQYDDLKNGKVKPIKGEEFFGSLLRREEATCSTHVAMCSRGPTQTQWT